MAEESGIHPWSVLEYDQRDDLRVALGRVGETLYAAEAFRPVLALGPQRSRKTTGLAVPSVLEWPGPAVVTSTGMDVIEQSIEARRRVGEVMIFDPSEVMDGWPERVGWNPLELIDTWDKAKTTAHVMVYSGIRSYPASWTRRERTDQPDFWFAAAAKLLAPLLFAAAKSKYTMADVMRWILTQEEFEVRSLLQATGEEAAMREADASWSRADNTRSSVYTTLEIGLETWGRASVQQASGVEPRFHLEDFFDGRANTLYICAPADEQEQYSPILTALTSTVLRRIYQINFGFSSVSLGLNGTAAALDTSSGRIRPLLIVLDDAGSSVPLRDLPSLISTATKVAVQLVTIFSDFSQIESLYGDAAARSILNNHAAILFLPGSHDASAVDLIDALMRNESVTNIPYLTSSAIRRLPHGHALCLYDNLPPMVIKLRSSAADTDLRMKRGLGDGND